MAANLQRSKDWEGVKIGSSFNGDISDISWSRIARDEVFFLVDKVDVNPTKWWLAGHKCTGWKVKLATLAQWKKDEKKTSHLEAKQNAEGLETWVDDQVTESYSENQQSRSTKQFIAKKWRH